MIISNAQCKDCGSLVRLIQKDFRKRSLFKERTVHWTKQVVSCTNTECKHGETHDSRCYGGRYPEWVVTVLKPNPKTLAFLETFSAEKKKIKTERLSGISEFSPCGNLQGEMSLSGSAISGNESPPIKKPGRRKLVL